MSNTENGTRITIVCESGGHLRLTDAPAKGQVA